LWIFTGLRRQVWAGVIVGILVTSCSQGAVESEKRKRLGHNLENRKRHLSSFCGLLASVSLRQHFLFSILWVYKSHDLLFHVRAGKIPKDSFLSPLWDNQETAL
jgi:hypothetical protein